MSSIKLSPADFRNLHHIGQALIRANGEARKLPQSSEHLAELREQQLRLHRDELNRIERICSEALGLGTLTEARAEAKFMRLRAELAECRLNWMIDRDLSSFGKIAELEIAICHTREEVIAIIDRELLKEFKVGK